jgi:tetratricopeptide (TPR) repeat protein
MRHRSGLVACLAGLGLAIAGCGARAAHPVAPAPVTATPDPGRDLSHAPHDPTPVGAPAHHPGTGAVGDLGTIRFDVVGRTGSGDPDVVAVVPAQILADGNALLTAGKQEQALAQFRRIVSEFPDSKLAPVALFNVALVYEHRGEIESAITTYRDLVKAYPTGRDSLDAHLRAAALVADRQDWPRALTLLDEILARTDLTHADKIEAFARKGYVQLERGELAPAEITLASAVTEWQRATRIDDPYFIAMAHYYLGEIAHRRFQAVQLHLPDEALKRDIGAKEALAVAAYDRWKEALELKNAYWATAAGYQMSQIFFELWDSSVHAPFPQAVDPRAKDAYLAEVHALVRPDLDKALEGHQMNVGLAGAYGVATTWSEASKQRATEIVQVIQGESAGVASHPTAH